MPKQCWNCDAEIAVADDFYGDANCEMCGVLNSWYNPADYVPPEGEEQMGKLADRAREKSPYIKLDIGEETPVLTYKSWKETTDNFGNETFRYMFELETENGMVTKQLDNRSGTFAEAMDSIAFGDKVILSRKPKLDHDGNPVEDKSVWSVRKAE